MIGRILLAVALLASCAEPVAVDPPEPLLRRLTSTQYTNSLRDLLGDEVVLPGKVEPDIEVSGLFSVGASVTTISGRGVEQYEAAAYDMAEQVMDTPAVRDRVVPCTPSGTVDAACADAFVRAFGRRAWRRPLADDEVERLVDVAGQAADTLGDFHEGLEFALAGILMSPNFLYRAELGEPDPDGGVRYTDHEMAARLSYLLWNTTPDDELLAAADAGELTTDRGLAKQATRLLEDERAHHGVRSFFTELYALHELDDLSKDPTIFVHMSAEVGPAAREETLLLLEHLVMEEDADFRTFFTTRTTFVDHKLASIYDIPAPAREGFAQTEFPDDERRRGFLGQISFLAGQGRPTGTSATVRGKFVRTRVLCHEVPTPPANVDTSIPEASGETPTLRDRVAEHLENPACAGCHLQLDTIGLGYENFDGLGRWRDTDNGVQIDPSGSLDGAVFGDAWELNGLVATHADTTRCLTKQLLRYGNGHVEGDGELDALTALQEGFARNDFRVLDLYMDLIMSPAFRQTAAIEEAP